jgi:hypothetical protein
VRCPQPHATDGGAEALSGWTAEIPQPTMRAVFMIPVPAARRSRTRGSLSGDSSGRPRLLTRAIEAGSDPLDDHGPLELGENTQRLEHRFSCRGASVEPHPVPPCPG